MYNNANCDVTVPSHLVKIALFHFGAMVIQSGAPRKFVAGQAAARKLAHARVLLKADSAAGDAA